MAAEKRVWSGLQSLLVLTPSKCQLNTSSLPWVCSRVRLLFNLVVCKLMAACALLRGVTGFKLVFQSKCLRMGCCCLCCSRFDTVSSAKKRKLLHGPSVHDFLLEKRLLIPELLSAIAVATADFTSILSIKLIQNQGKNACDYKPVINHVSLINTPDHSGGCQDE